jgi:hypothetical protein
MLNFSSGTPQDKIVSKFLVLNGSLDIDAHLTDVAARSRKRTTTVKRKLVDRGEMQMDERIESETFQKVIVTPLDPEKPTAPFRGNWVRLINQREKTLRITAV